MNISGSLQALPRGSWSATGAGYCCCCAAVIEFQMELVREVVESELKWASCWCSRRSRFRTMAPLAVLSEDDMVLDRAVVGD